MARKALIEDDALIDLLSATFREVGYEAASLALLAESTGLKKASLYHRFPGGKEQMGLEVLQEAGRWLTEHVLQPLTGEGTPEERITAMTHALDAFYRSGKQACLLNLLSSPIGEASPFKATIHLMFDAFIETLAQVVTEGGCSADVARDRAIRGVALIQGSLVLARGLESTEPFLKALEALPGELLEGVGSRT